MLHAMGASPGATTEQTLPSSRAAAAAVAHHHGEWRSGIVLAVVLRNVLNLEKYPEDRRFHSKLIEERNVQEIHVLDGDAFPGTFIVS